MECWASAVYAKEHSKYSENGERENFVVDIGNSLSNGWCLHSSSIRCVQLDGRCLHLVDLINKQAEN